MSPARIAATAVTLTLLCACQNVPKYKKSSGKFNEWSGYEGQNFSPSEGIVVAVNPPANTVTVLVRGKNVVLNVLPTTRVLHEGVDITVAQLPLNQAVKIRFSKDGKELRSIWYGEHSNAVHHNVAAKSKNSLF
jgi:hypothetical protein